MKYILVECHHHSYLPTPITCYWQPIKKLLVMQHNDRSPDRLENMLLNRRT